MKQVIVVNNQLKMSKGKTSVQVAHASLGAFLRTPKSISRTWREEGQKKIVVKADALESLEEQAYDLGVSSFLVFDAGLTELSPGTITALGLGPDEDERLDKITGKLLLL